MNNTCGMCGGECFNVCESCHLGTTDKSKINKWSPGEWKVKCPNKCVHHYECICLWAYHESYCPKCEAELLDFNTCSSCHQGR